MHTNKEKLRKWIYAAAAILVVLCVLIRHYGFAPWGFYRATEEKEANLRQQTVAYAESFLGLMESDGSHKPIIDQYNAHEPLAVGYVVQYEDSWCATYVSTVAIGQELTDIIPTECSCERQIALWQELGRWQEKDSYVPLPGDIIYYDWQEYRPGDCTGWSDHVGIVVGSKWPFLKVIEGNKDDSVAYRILRVNDISIRGFGLPDYASKIQ
ncbi:MAG: CHAP domain-containing protein [Oscillospiraceae bacterium]|nr:CHAP domain-containing protein [Oscillospiraceae bacterium]